MTLKDYEYYKTDLGVLYCGSCEDILPLIGDKSIDLVVTSPPYDELRDYKGYSFDFNAIAQQLFRTSDIGGVVVWVVGDATVDGSETGTSFKQALYFKERGFNLHDTMIYDKHSIVFPSNNRYHQTFEYMFVLSKGNLKTFNPIKDRRNFYTKTGGCTKRQKNGEMNREGRSGIQMSEFGQRFNVWQIDCGYGKSTKDKIAYEHPAIFPDKLAQDHIISWSNKGDLVMDIFMGSGTTAVACEKLGRKWVGIEISKDYCRIAKQRISQEFNQLKLF